MTGMGRSRRKNRLTDDNPIYSRCHARERDDPRSKQRKIIDKLADQIVRLCRTFTRRRILFYQRAALLP